MTAFLERFVPLVQRDLSVRNIAFEALLSEPKLVIHANPRALHQVLLNLIANAADAVEQVPQPKIQLSVASQGREVEIAVQDNGSGMTDEQQSRLFQPFQTNKAHGTGLGLVITQRLVAQMNGTLAISTQYQLGTRAVTSFERS